MTKNRIANWAMNNGALVGLIALCIALFIATPYFLTVANLLNVGIQAATVAILAFGMTFVIVTAGIDLSVGSVAALGAMVSAYMFSNAGLPGWLTLLIGLFVGALAGAICGMATAWGKIPSFIATLAMMSIARGITLVISQGSPIETAPTVNAFGGDVFGFPVPIIMMVIAGVICWFILERTVLGRSMYAIGGNLEAARLSGLPVRRIQIAVFALPDFSPPGQEWLWRAALNPHSHKPEPAMSWMLLQPLSSVVPPFPADKAKRRARSLAPSYWP